MSTSSTHIQSLIHEELDIIAESIKKAYNTPYGALYAPFDDAMQGSVEHVVKKMHQGKPTLLMLVGIGGSSMTTQAVAQILSASENPQILRFYCADTIDELYTKRLLSIFEEELLCGGRPILCIVTKSGTTTETIMNAALFIDLLKKYRPETYRTYVLVITDTGSPLSVSAQQEGFEVIEIPPHIGGRFSAFSPAALVPLALLGIDIKGFCAGAVSAFEKCMHGVDNEASQSATMLYENYQAGFDIHALFVFSPDLFMLGNWYKQLIGESLGKAVDRKGNKIVVGMCPVVSVGTTDLHSVAQLYLAGPYNTFTSFIFFSDESENMYIPDNEMSRLIPGLVGRSVTEVKNAILQGTMASYRAQQRPFMSTVLTRTSESVGAYMMKKMLETMFIARLWNINPFDQPEVELYKKETRVFLQKT